jgi:CheY-like chemotaxis protein
VTKILVIEDNEMNLQMISRRLSRLGHEVLGARDGAAGIAVAEAEKPQLIFMDMRLPVLDGWETTRRLKANPATKKIPVIALTAQAMSDDRAKALAAGCDDYLSKPVELPLLIEKIKHLVPGDDG